MLRGSPISHLTKTARPGRGGPALSIVDLGHIRPVLVKGLGWGVILGWVVDG